MTTHMQSSTHTAGVSAAAQGLAPLERRPVAQPTTNQGPTGDVLAVTPVGTRIHQNLVTGNKDALAQAWQTTKTAVAHPLNTLGTLAKSTGQMIASPGKAVSSVTQAYKRDRSDGAIQAAALGAGYVGLAAMGTIALAYAAAIPTRGYSFRLISVAGKAATVSGHVGMAAMGASLVKNQLDVAAAPNAAVLKQQSKELSHDFINVGAAAGMAVTGVAIQKVAQKYVPKNVNPGCGQRVADRLHGRIVKKLGLATEDANRGIVKMNGMNVDEVRATGLQEMQRGINQGSQGGKIIAVKNVDRGSFAGIDHVGDRVLMFHGTRDIHSASIRTNGLRSGTYGDFGEGIYLGSTGKIGENYASAVAMRETAKPRLAYSLEVATGKVFDYVANRKDYETWAMANFDPTDASSAINQVYANVPKHTTTPFVDLNMNKYMKLYCEAKGYNSILIKDWDGLGQNYFVIHDPKRVIIRQEFHLDPPQNIRAVPASFNGLLAGSVVRGAAAAHQP